MIPHRLKPSEDSNLKTKHFTASPSAKPCVVNEGFEWLPERYTKGTVNCSAGPETAVSDWLSMYFGKFLVRIGVISKESPFSRFVLHSDAHDEQWFPERGG